MSDEAAAKTRPIATPSVLRFVCALGKSELRFPPRTKYETANAELGRRGWAVMELLDDKGFRATWGLCCGECVKALTEANSCR